MGIVDDLARYLVIDILHPAAFLVLGPLDGFLLRYPHRKCNTACRR